MSVESFISRRYLSTRHKPLFVSFLLFITALAVAAGVFALIFVMSVMNGFEIDLQKKVLGFKAPMTIEASLEISPEEVKHIDPRIWKVTPFAEGEAVVQSELGSTLGVRVRGVSGGADPERFGRLYEQSPFKEKCLLMGEELASSLQVHPDFTEKLRLIFPLGDISPTGDLTPRIRMFTLTGLFRSGFYDFDSKYVLVPYQDALNLFGNEARIGLEVWVQPLSVVEEVKRKIQIVLGRNDSRTVPTVKTWRDQNPRLFAAMKLEKIGMFVLLSALLLIASFNIFGLTSLSAAEKIKDMAILRSLGLSGKKVRRIFLLKAAAIGISGGFAGGIAGLVATILLQRHPVRLPSSYYLEFLPVRIDPREVALTLFLIPLVTTLAAIYPAWKASKAAPVEVLRYE